MVTEFASVRLPVATKKAVQQLADTQRRSLSQMLRILIEQALVKEGRKKK